MRSDGWTLICLTVFGNWASKEVNKLKWGQWGGVLIQRSFKKRKGHWGCVCTEERPCEDSEKAAICRPRREASGARKLDKEPLAFKTVRNTFLLFLPQSLRKSVRVALRCGFSGGASGDDLPANAGDLRDVGSASPGSGRFSGGGNGNPLQYSYLENPVDREAWQAAVLGVTNSLTWLKQLSMHACTHACTALSWLIYSLTDDFFPRTFYEIETSGSVNESVLRTMTNHCSKANARLNFLAPLWMQRLFLVLEH